jgi:hypothetical protein
MDVPYDPDDAIFAGELALGHGREGRNGRAGRILGSQARSAILVPAPVASRWSSDVHFREADVNASYREWTHCGG